LFAAVSSDGTNRVMTSPDGITWTARAAAEADYWGGVAWSAEMGLFAAVAQSGGNRVMTSPDGITWTARGAGGTSLFGIASSPALSRFVAVGASSVMTYSYS
jgi:hypothetical protein